MNLKKSIVICCAKKEVTTGQLASMIGVGSPRISQLKTTGTCTSDTLEKLAKAFDMSVSEFIHEGES